jgi:hypothetical protein
MPLSGAPVVVLRRAGRVLVGHVAVGNGVAGVAQRRCEDPARSYTDVVVGAGAPVHGSSGAGLVCIALDAGGQVLVPRALEGAGRAQDVPAALNEAGRGRRDVRVHPGALLAVDGSGAIVVEVGEDGSVAARDAEVAEVAEVADVAEVSADRPIATDDPSAALLQLLFSRLRQVEPKPQEGAAPVAGLAAVLTADQPPSLHIALGPPSCSVFVRHWPGLEVGPDEAATPEGAPLARLAAAVAQTTGTDPELRRTARQRLDRAEAEALREGEAAERMAIRMDAATDDWGAAVRRLVAQSYAVGLAKQALEELAVPAPPGSKPGPRL